MAVLKLYNDEKVIKYFKDRNMFMSKELLKS